MTKVLFKVAFIDKLFSTKMLILKEKKKTNVVLFNINYCYRLIGQEAIFYKLIFRQYSDLKVLDLLTSAAVGSY